YPRTILARALTAQGYLVSRGSGALRKYLCVYWLLVFRQAFDDEQVGIGHEFIDKRCVNLATCPDGDPMFLVHVPTWSDACMSFAECFRIQRIRLEIHNLPAVQLGQEHEHLAANLPHV